MKIRTKAPLRLGLAGGGTDLSSYADIYGGVVLNATINLYAHCTIETMDNKEVEFVATDIKEIFKSEALSSFEIDGLLSLHKGVYNRIVHDYNQGIPLGVRVVTYSDALPGSGLGTSSTMVVALIKGYSELLQLPLGDYDIASLACSIERDDLNLAGGKQDQYAATFGGINFIEFYAGNQVIVNPLRVKNWIIDELQESLVLFFTGISRSSAHIIENQIKATNENKENNLEGMHELKKSAYKMKEALLKGDFEALANELEIGWQAKKKTSEIISTPYIESIYNTALKSGAKAGKISGAGGGGFMMFICDPTAKSELIKALEALDCGVVCNIELTSHGSKGWYI